MLFPGLMTASKLQLWNVLLSSVNFVISLSVKHGFVSEVA